MPDEIKSSCLFLTAAFCLCLFLFLGLHPAFMHVVIHTKYLQHNQACLKAGLLHSTIQAQISIQQVVNSDHVALLVVVFYFFKLMVTNGLTVARGRGKLVY